MRNLTRGSNLVRGTRARLLGWQSLPEGQRHNTHPQHRTKCASPKGPGPVDRPLQSFQGAPRRDPGSTYHQVLHLAVSPHPGPKRQPAFPRCVTPRSSRTAPQQAKPPPPASVTETLSRPTSPSSEAGHCHRHPKQARRVHFGPPSWHMPRCVRVRVCAGVRARPASTQACRAASVHRAVSASGGCECAHL